MAKPTHPSDVRKPVRVIWSGYGPPHATLIGLPPSTYHANPLGGVCTYDIE
jgi:hypothetical protein